MPEIANVRLTTLTINQSTLGGALKGGKYTSAACPATTGVRTYSRLNNLASALTARHIKHARFLCRRYQDGTAVRPSS